MNIKGKILRENLAFFNFLQNGLETEIELS